MFSKAGRAKIRTNPCEIESRAKIRHKSVMLSGLQLSPCFACFLKMPERCVAVRCGNIKDEANGISMHFNDEDFTRLMSSGLNLKRELK